MNIWRPCSGRSATGVSCIYSHAHSGPHVYTEENEGNK